MTPTAGSTLVRSEFIGDAEGRVGPRVVGGLDSVVELGSAVGVTTDAPVDPPGLDVGILGSGTAGEAREPLGAAVSRINVPEGRGALARARVDIVIAKMGGKGQLSDFHRV